VTRDLEGQLFAAAALCLAASDPAEKVALTEVAAAAWHGGSLTLADDGAITPIGATGRPERPPLVSPRELPRRRPNSPEGRAALVHAVAHIEFSAINLAWDAVYRFRGLPCGWYDDWVQVAAEEARHFAMMRGRRE
jgi:uncharacterized ferritin-like protein (DUF455 family)